VSSLSDPCCSFASAIAAAFRSRCARGWAPARRCSSARWPCCWPGCWWTTATATCDCRVRGSSGKRGASQSPRRRRLLRSIRPICFERAQFASKACLRLGHAQKHKPLLRTKAVRFSREPSQCACRGNCCQKEERQLPQAPRKRGQRLSYAAPPATLRVSSAAAAAGAPAAAAAGAPS